GQLPGRLRDAAESKASLPVVGDWVLVKPIAQGAANQVVIERLLTRKSSFSRKESGAAMAEQVLAANIDTAFIVSGLDGDFNPNRIERYLLLGWDSGAQPVIILNKTDLCPDAKDRARELQPIAMDTPILLISALAGTGLEQLQAFMGPGKTSAFIGSSGVGKSTIINRLAGQDKFTTGPVRQGDSKGRHTTTFREMLPLAKGGLVIDTPGLREVQAWADDADLAKSFGDIEDLAVKCRFRDCAHQREPGCAVRYAVADGSLAAPRLVRYHRLQEELSKTAEAAKQKTKQGKNKNRNRR
ncbi:MAG: ribosome small subunit-dependent GTPase A, partial [Pseudomonadales bacterium]